MKVTTSARRFLDKEVNNHLQEVVTTWRKIEGRGHNDGLGKRAGSI